MVVMTCSTLNDLPRLGSILAVVPLDIGEALAGINQYDRVVEQRTNVGLGQVDVEGSIECLTLEPVEAAVTEVNGHAVVTRRYIDRYGDVNRSILTGSLKSSPRHIGEAAVGEVNLVLVGVTAIQMVLEGVTATVAIAVQIDVNTLLYFHLLFLTGLMLLVRHHRFDDHTFGGEDLGYRREVVVLEQIGIACQFVEQGDGQVLSYVCTTEDSGGDMSNRIVEFDAVERTLLGYLSYSVAVGELSRMNLCTADTYIGLAYGELAVSEADGVVLCGSIARYDLVLTDVRTRLIRRGELQTADYGSVVIVLPSAVRSVERRCEIAVGYGGVVSRDGQGSLSHGHLTGYVLEVVVLRLSAVSRDDVLAYAARRSVQAGELQPADELGYTCAVVVAPAEVCRCVGRYGVTVDDVLVLSNYDHQRLLNG